MTTYQVSLPGPEHVSEAGVAKLLLNAQTYFCDELIPTIAHRGWSNITHIKSNMAAGRHLEKMDITS